MWAELRKTYEIKEETEYFDKYKYLDRVHKEYPGWKWPGKNSGRWRPPLTHPSDELISKLEQGTKFTVSNILYQAVSGGMKYQAVEALVDNSDGRYVQSKVDKTGFIWIWHKDKQFFKEVEKKEENKEKEEPDKEWKEHLLTDEEIKSRKWIPDDYRKNWKVFAPAMKLHPIDYQEDDKYTLYGYEPHNKNKIIYEKTVTIKNDEIKEDDKESTLYFLGAPRGLKYKLEIDPAPDSDGKKREKYTVFEDKGYAEDYSF
jgi:hypothetical protein